MTCPGGPFRWDLEDYLTGIGYAIGMKRRAMLALALCLCGAAWRYAQSGPSAESGLEYEAVCDVISADLVEGLVVNRGQGSIQVLGYVRFIVESPGSVQRKEFGLNASAVVPPGQRVRVAWTGLPFSIKKPEVCRFDVSGAIRKL